MTADKRGRESRATQKVSKGCCYDFSCIYRTPGGDRLHGSVSDRWPTRKKSVTVRSEELCTPNAVRRSFRKDASSSFDSAGRNRTTTSSLYSLMPLKRDQYEDEARAGRTVCLFIFILLSVYLHISLIYLSTYLLSSIYLYSTANGA